MNYITGFVQDCRLRGLTKHTIETYTSQVIVFLEMFPEPRDTTLDDLRAFLEALRARRLHGSTLKGYFYALGTFFAFLEYGGVIKANPVHGFRKRHLSRVRLQMNERDRRQLISVQQMQLLVSAAPGIREKAILMVLAKTGMRRGEFLDLREKDIDLRNGVILVPPKAKRTYCTAFIDEELAAVMTEYLVWRKKRAKSDWLWITGHGGRIHRDYAGIVLAALGGQFGLHKAGGPLSVRLTPHCLRHWFVTHLFRAGMQIDYIKWLRGDSIHEDPWQLYNHIDPEEVRQEYLRRIPRLISFDRKITAYTGVQRGSLKPGCAIRKNQEVENE